MNNGNKPVR